MLGIEINSQKSSISPEVEVFLHKYVKDSFLIFNLDMGRKLRPSTKVLFLGDDFACVSCALLDQKLYVDIY